MIDPFSPLRFRGLHRGLQLLSGAIALGTVMQRPLVATAQIVPDHTLGNERSIVRPDSVIRGAVGDRIDGGAVRGQQLFHSFTDFNVSDLQRVYFANPAGIDTILSRVTGTAPSDILGTLGVLGPADLFLINPNGIVFGPDAVLDINGSFVASTADRVQFENGYAFSAAEPNGPPLLNVSGTIAGLSRWLPQTGTIQSAGDLTVGDSLVLAADTIDLQGSLTAGGDIQAIARQLAIRDRPSQPVSLAAGGQLLLQGNQRLDISVLDHPASGLSAGDDLRLRSNAPVVADAVFQAGGNLKIETTRGNLGSVTSIGDPVFETAGDFAAESYTGASLQILAGGSVTIPGEIIIDSAGGPFNDSTVQLSNGMTLTLQGTLEPTVDIRAGTTQFFGPVAGAAPSSADITVGPISTPGGLVYLTNQFQPNPTLDGDITASLIVTADEGGGGSVVMDSQGQLTFNLIDTSGGFLANAADVGIFDALPGPAGNVTLLAAGDIVMPFVLAPESSFFSPRPGGHTSILAFGTRGGTVVLESDTAILQESAPFGTDPNSLNEIQSFSVGDGPNGTVSLSAPFISLGGNVQTTALGPSDSGDIIITADRLETDQATILTDTFGPASSGALTIDAEAIALDFSLLGTATTSGSGGGSGDITIRAETLEGVRGAQIASLGCDGFGACFFGNAGDIDVTAERISFSGFQPGNLTGGIFAASGIFASVQPLAVGNSGNITVTTDQLRLADGAAISTSSFGDGRAGNIRVDASESIQVDGAVFTPFDGLSHPSSISSEILAGAEGRGGSIQLNTGVLEVSDGGTITAASNGQGNAGSIRIVATESAQFDGIRTFENVGLRRISQANVFVGDNSNGQAGNLTIITPALALTRGGQLTAESRGTLADNSGGNIQLQVPDVVVLSEGSRISSTAGVLGVGGDGGNITINSTFVVAGAEENNDITANAFDGQGGRVEITAAGIFGLTPRGRADLENLLGTTDPEALDPANLPSSDITAISQANPTLDGLVIVRSPDVDPSRSATTLPTAGVDVSQLIAQGCSASGAVAQQVGSLIVTGRGGLPYTPSQTLGHQDLALDWEESIAPAEAPPSAEPLSQSSPLEHRRETTEQGSPVSPAPVSLAPESSALAAPTTLVEMDALTRRADGKVVLTAQAPGSHGQRSWNSRATCVSPLP